METIVKNNWKVQQIYTGCLAEAAYLIVSEGEAAIIDPLRETAPYIEKLKEEGATLKYIFETHFHADFVSGHVDLAQKTGAHIVFGPNAEAGYDMISATDGQEFKVGAVTLKTLHTPGHTMESTTFLLLDEEGREQMIFTGDTLFIGDVGRPDLAVKSDLTQEDLAGHLYDSLRGKIMTLPNDVIVYPGHGAGSACGKNMSKETWDSLGNQKEVNYALRADMTKEDFIKEVTDGLATPPQYFGENVRMNKSGYESFDQVKERGMIGLSPQEFEEMAEQTGALVLDVRNQSEFVLGHIPKSIFIGLDGQFAPWVGALIPDLHQNILIVAPEGREEETITRLSRVGYDHAIGYLKGSFDAWKNAGKEVDTLESISADEFAERVDDKDLSNVLDVRKDGEFAAEHLDGAVHLSLDTLSNNLDKVDGDKTYFVHCAGGYRSVIAASMLKARGYHKLVDVKGGYGAIKKTDLPKTDFVCPSTLN